MAYPTLNTNAIYSNLYNQIVGITVEGKNIADRHANLLNAMRLDVSKYGDTKIFIETDVLESYPFEQDTEDMLNVLAVKRSQPVAETVTIDEARQIMVTVDDFGISSRAFGSEGAFASFNSAVVAWVAETKNIYEAMYYNAYFGTAVATGDAQNITVDGDAATLAQNAAYTLANLFVEMSVPCRDYNDKGLMRSFDRSDVVMVWNSKYLSQIKKIDVPVLFGGDKVMPDEEYTLAPRYFGTVNTASKAKADSKTRSLVEITVGSGSSAKHYFPGELIATGTDLVADGEIVIPSYQEDEDIICKIVGKGALPFLTGVSAGTEFVNGRNNSRNHYLTWTFGKGRLQAKPLITLKAE